MPSIFLAEETLDPSYLPPRLVRREKEFATVLQRYRAAAKKGLAYHLLVTGGVGSGKTAFARRLAEELGHAGPGATPALVGHYVNCWRRSTDRLVLLELLRGVGVYLPDKGYGLPDMIDVLEQGIRKSPAHRLVILDEAGGLIRQETRIVYLLTRSSEVSLGTISLLLVAPDDVLAYLDAASRSSFGVSHRLALRPYGREDLAEILAYRAQLALRGGSYGPELLDQIAALAAPTADARFALELLQAAARVAEEDGNREIAPEHVRSVQGSLRPSFSEANLEGLDETQLLVLLGLARTLRGPTTRTPTGTVRQSYAQAAAELGREPVSRVTFWRTVRALEMASIVQVEPARPGRPARLGMDEVPVAVLRKFVEHRLARRPTSDR